MYVCLKTMPDEMLLIEKNTSRSRHYDGSLMILREFIPNNETTTGVKGYTNTNDDDEGVGGHWGSTPDMTTKVNTLLLDSCMKFCTRWCNRRFFLATLFGNMHFDCVYYFLLRGQHMVMMEQLAIIEITTPLPSITILITTT